MILWWQGPSDGTQTLKASWCAYHNQQQNQSSNQNSLIHVDLWGWLINHGVTGNETDRKPTKFLFDYVEKFKIK